MGMALRGGDVVLADWRDDLLPGEANKRQPAIVVDGDAIFDPDFPTTLLVPLTDTTTSVIRSMSVLIVPTAENGCSKPCWAVSYLATATSKSRVRATGSRISRAELDQIRSYVVKAIGL
jgi:mRNA interferase MazF